MRIAVISDIHANMEAFETVLADIDASNADQIISLGDNIGYGPEPEAVLNLIRKRNIFSVMGNHELAVVNSNYLSWFNPNARMSIEKTFAMLSDESLQHICKLRAYLVDHNCRHVHGIPPDSITTYQFEISEDEFTYILCRMRESICFIGHTHILEMIEFDGFRALRRPLNQGVVGLNGDKKYVINVGSVGQPRDGDNHAKYVVWDTCENLVEVKFVAYDIESVVEKIISAGLPEVHALRLR